MHLSLAHGILVGVGRHPIKSSIAYRRPVRPLLALQNLIGVRIPYLALNEFRGVIEILNSVGGVEVYVANPIYDPQSKLRLAAGTHSL
jgi:anionic cell wall polymer biosynthesis LytR-Cps2A-Psr (LCP) family protein